MMAKFDSLLNQIHGSTAAGPLAVDTNEYIQITSSRRFVLPKDFDTVIAYEGDVNSQVVTFQCAKLSDGHDLSLCSEKRLRWYNTGSRNEGSSVLPYEVTGDTMLLRWEAPPEAFTQSGQLQISITISDYSNNRLVYSWNTSTFEQLSVGASLETVGGLINKGETLEYVPSKNEILVVDAETREIVAPNGYNYVLCNYGDVGTSVVYFQVKRYIRGIDLLAEDTHISAYWKLRDLANVDRDDRFSKVLNTVELEGRDSEGLVTLVWTPSKSLTQNTLFYSGNVTIQLEISSPNRIWKTNPYQNLKIGENPFPVDVEELPVEEAAFANYIVDGAVISDMNKTSSIAGLVKLRTCTQSQPIFIHQNEIVIEYDNNGNYVGAKIGAIPNQDSRQAPYVAYAPSVTILLDGGHANG